MTTAAIPMDRQSPWRDEFRATLALAWPLILTNVTMVLINITDVKLLALLGPDALAASGLGSSIVIAMLLIGIGIVIAGSPLMAAELGRKAYSVRDIRRTFRQSLWAATAVCIPVWVLLWNTGAVLNWAGQPAKLASDTGIYVQALMWMLWPQLGIVAIRSFMAALELPRWTMVAGLAAVIVNAFVSYGLIFGYFGLPRWGLWGAGIGSSLTSLFQFLFLAVIVIRHPKFRRYHLFGRWWRSDWSRFATIWKLGLPIGLHMGFEAMVFSAAIFLMGYISIAATAAHAVAIQIVAMTFMVPMGLGQAATVRVGLGYGRLDADAIQRAGWMAYALGVGFMTAMAIVIWAVPDMLAGFFLDPELKGNAEVLRLAVSFLLVAAVFQIVDGAQVVGTGMLRGLQDTTWPMLFAAFGYWVVGLGFGCWLAFYKGFDGAGIWIGLALGLGIVAALVLVRWLMRARLELLPVRTEESPHIVKAAVPLPAGNHCAS
jgi:multidrug resistance protein, MATE family